jgi:hypothetical protein
MTTRFYWPPRAFDAGWDEALSEKLEVLGSGDGDATPACRVPTVGSPVKAGSPQSRSNKRELSVLA